MLAARALGIRRRIFLLRGLRFEGFTGAARTLLMGTDRIAAACAHDIVCVSDSVRRAVLTSRISPPSKTTTIPSNGIDASRFRSRSMTRESARKTRADLGIPPDAVVAGFVGRLVPEKGVEDMLSALEAATNVWLLLVGGDLAGDALPQSITDRLAHPRVVRVGPVDDPAPYYEAMDLLLFPSYREGLPNVPLEAAASELPVIGSTAKLGCSFLFETRTRSRMHSYAMRRIKDYVRPMGSLGGHACSTDSRMKPHGRDGCHSTASDTRSSAELARPRKPVHRIR
jgi:glycosyltransferase involved in cell wall biosynthesis